MPEAEDSAPQAIEPSWLQAEAAAVKDVDLNSDVVADEPAPVAEPPVIEAKAEPEPEPEKAEAADPEPEKPSRGIPKERFDEVNERRKAAEQEAQQLRETVARLEGRMEGVTAKAAAPVAQARDFDTELADLDNKLEEGELSSAEYNKATRAIVLEQARVQAIASLRQEEAERANQAAQQRQSRFEEAYVKFVGDEANAELKSRIVRSGFDAECVRLANEDPSLKPAELLKQARENVLAELGILKPKDEPAATPRQVAAALKHTQTAALPGATNAAGSSNRDTIGRFTKNVSRNDFLNLPQSEQDKLLGITA